MEKMPCAIAHITPICTVPLGAIDATTTRGFLFVSSLFIISATPLTVPRLSKEPEVEMKYLSFFFVRRMPNLVQVGCETQLITQARDQRDCPADSFVLTLFIFKAPNYVLARTLTERVV